MTRTIVCLMTLIFVLALDGSAQAVPSPGDRIRIIQVDGPVLTGTLVTFAEETIQLYLDSESPTVEVPVEGIEALETSLGQRTRYGKYIPVSMLGGALVGAAYGAITGDPSSTGFLSGFDQPEFRAAVGFVYGGLLIGLPVGLILGSVFSEERWNPVSLPAPVASGLSIRPVIGSGVGFVGSLRVGGL